MHVIVVGCGRVGSELAISLDEAGHTVSVIDKQRDAFHRLPERFSGRAVLGFGFDRDHLEQAGIGEAKALAAVTSGDNSNILTARIARETYNIANVVARIYDPRRALIFQRAGIPTVATVTWSTDQVRRRLFGEQNNVDWLDPSGKLSLVERSLPVSWAGRSYDELIDDAFKLVAVTRAGSARLMQAGLIAQEGDLMHVMVCADAQDAFDTALVNQASH